MAAESAGPRSYVEELERWRQKMDSTLRSETGWLTLTGLYWLGTGANSVGSGADCDVVLPAGAPVRLGTIDYDGTRATLHVASGLSVAVNGTPATEVVLYDMSVKAGPVMAAVGSVTFFVIERSGSHAVRVRDANNPARTSFEGRKWFPPDRKYVVKATYTPHETPRKLQIENSVGQIVPMNNPGRVTFRLHGIDLGLEAFEGGENELWFVLRDATSGTSTYKSCRFLYAQLGAEGAVRLDFNRTYHPPCAFTPYSTCPLPPQGNVLPVAIEAGERLANPAD